MVAVEACSRSLAPASTSTGAAAGSAQPDSSANGPSIQPLQGVGAGQGAPPPAPAAPGQVAVTSNADFYVVAYNQEQPGLPGDWNLQVSGNVGNPVTFSLADIQGMPAVHEMRTLECISNPAGGPLISNALWTGIKMKDLMQRVGVKPNTVELKLESFDGYSTAIPLDLALDDHSLLVYEMNGQPLPIEHGKPLRCLWPGRYGMKQPKWIQKITAITDKYLGYWEQQGWSDQAYVLPNSRIDRPPSLAKLSPPTFQTSGIGFSGAAGIAKIEVSWDGGKNWHEASLVRGPTPYVWTNWSWGGATPSPGQYTLLSRVTDNDGNAQTPASLSFLGDTFPNGTSSMQGVVVEFEKG
jgi:DMSO/TMAO reductase YedYZ molybdopterin-dependent catalytic subunit